MTQCQDRICSGLGATLAVIHDIDTQFFLVNLTGVSGTGLRRSVREGRQRKW